MPYKDNPIRHKADLTGRHCDRCSVLLPDLTEPYAIVCSKTDGWILGDVAWAVDCTPPVLVA